MTTEVVHSSHKTAVVSKIKFATGLEENVGSV